MSVQDFLALKVPLTDAQGNMSREWRDWFKQRHARTEQSLDLQGQITGTAKIAGRTEPLKTTVQNVDTTGIVLAAGVDLARAYTNKHLGNIPDDVTSDRRAATANQKTGGDRGFSAINSSNRLASSQNHLPVSSNGAFNGANPLTQHGVTTQIDVAAWGMQFGSGLAGASNTGSVDPGSFGTWYVYCDMAVLTLFISSPPSYFATANVFDLTAGEGRIVLGKITTAGGGGGVGAGTGGGGNSGIRQLV